MIMPNQYMWSRKIVNWAPRTLLRKSRAKGPRWGCVKKSGFQEGPRNRWPKSSRSMAFQIVSPKKIEEQVNHVSSSRGNTIVKEDICCFQYMNVTSLKPELGSEVITEKKNLQSVVPRTLKVDHFRWVWDGIWSTCHMGENATDFDRKLVYHVLHLFVYHNFSQGLGVLAWLFQDVGGTPLLVPYLQVICQYGLSGRVLVPKLRYGLKPKSLALEHNFSSPNCTHL